MNFLRALINLFRFDRANWRAVALCILAASIFWVFNAFNKSYATNIKFPLQFEYNQDRFVSVNSLPKEITVNVSGYGWDLFQRSIGMRLPKLVIPLDRPTEVKKIVGSSLPPLLSNQLGGLTINFVLDDTLRLQIDERDSHKFMVTPDLSQVSFKEGYARSSPVVILPDSVTLVGPKSLLHQLPSSLVVLLPEVSLNKSFREDIEIQVPASESLIRNPSVVSVMFDVAAVEVIERKIGIMLTNTPGSIKSSYLDSVKIKVQIPKDQLINFESEFSAISAILDLKNKSKGAYKVCPAVVGLPKYAELISIDSLLVTF
ncbi:MAG: hypothetical protein IPK96_00540 [Flammeovirgaceae bacterium]|jgi:hypothetical protein|nr:hypothetical protein [Flammeovirgaceae bacterium]